MKYRADIDGVRAIAVALVVLYHAHIPGFGGGFVGVDVFFVLSGFLITRILADELAAGRFSLGRFFERRIRRLLPASTVMGLITALVASVLLVPRALVHTGESLIAAALYSSNVYFWREADYFGPAAEEMPLLHTWSLGVEEQFYFVMPLGLTLTQRLTGGRHLRVLLPAALASFAFSAWSVTELPTSTFFLLPARAWELLAGSALALAGLRPLHGLARELLALAGLAAIAATGLLYTAEIPFPGPSALPPVLGTLALLHAGTTEPSRVNQALSARPMVWLGQRSYSFYLWHWPVFVFAQYAMLRRPTPWEGMGLIVICLALAEASWRWVEQPFRHPVEGARGRAFAGAAGAMALSCALGVVLVGTGGFPGRFPHPREVASGERLPEGCALGSRHRPEDWAGESCRIASSNPRRALLWGDSQAQHLIPGVLAHQDELEVDLFVRTMTLCPPVLGLSVPGRPRCEAFNAGALEVIAAYDIEVVVLAARWELVFKRAGAPELLRATLDALRERGIEVVVLGQTPIFPADVPDIDTRHNDPGRTLASFPTTTHEPVNLSLREITGDLRFIDPGPHLCNPEGCAYLTNGELLYSDDTHLSGPGSEAAVRAYFPFVRAD